MTRRGPRGNPPAFGLGWLGWPAVVSFADCRAYSYSKNFGVFAQHCSPYVLIMRSKRPAKLSEIQHARLLQAARVFCSTLNGLSASVAPSAADYWALHDLNAAVLAAVEKLTGQPAPWIMPPLGASSPDCNG